MDNKQRSHSRDKHGNGDVIVVVPVRNEESNINDCLNALLNMDYKSGRVIIVVVDNGSTDRTQDYVKRFNDVVLVCQEYGTIASLRNIGASLYDTKYIAFLDGDCIPPKDWLSIGISLLSQQDVSCIGFAMSPPMPDDTWVRKAWFAMNSNSRYKGTCAVNWLSSFNLIIKRKYFEQIGGFDESLETCEDMDIGLKLNNISTLLFSDIITIKHIGEVKTLREFFWKELWRGQSNWQNILNKFYRRKAILNVIIPLFYLCSIVGLLLTFMLNIHVALWCLFFIFLLPVLFVAYKTKLSYKMMKSPKMIFLGSVYLAARGLSFIIFLKNRFKNLHIKF